jgi:uncharacterized protein DUF4337
MEEQEVNVEPLHDIVHEHASQASWSEKVALTTALLAMFAAGSNLASSYQSDQAILFRIEASDQWAYYQSKGVKGMVTQDAAERERYKKEQEGIREDAERLSYRSHHAHRVHEFFAYAVTLFQVATAIGAIAVLVKRKYFWYSSILLGVAGLGLILKGAAVLYSR